MLSSNQKIKYCTAENCRFPQYHVTSGHKCGKCGQYGHGLMECGSPVKLSKLFSSLGFILPIELHCKFNECKYNQYHTTNGHHCSTCHERLHSATTCPKNVNLFDKKTTLNIKCPLCKQDNQVNKDQQKIFGLTDTCVICLGNKVEVFFPNCGHVCVCLSCFEKVCDDNTDDEIRTERYLYQHGYQLDKIKLFLPDYPSFTTVYEGMGCFTLVRRLNSKSHVEGLFNHSDDHYCPIKSEKIKKFLDGYCSIPSNNNDFLAHNLD
jgi:hypothetical protein